MKFAYRNREFWCKGYYVDAAGKNTKAIKTYIAEQLSRDKETDQLLGQDAPIDHFRPKAKVKQYENYNYNRPLADKGYFWLSREPKNYRLSCTYANRKTGEGGKGCFFRYPTKAPI